MPDEPKISARDKFIRGMIAGMKQDTEAFYERRGDLYVDAALYGGKELVKLRSQGFTTFLLDLAHRNDNVLLKASDADLIADHVSSYADRVAKPLSSDPRACWVKNDLWLHPGWKDGKLIRIADGRWSVEAAPGRLFAPLPQSMAMPVPVPTPASAFPSLIKQGIVDFGQYHAFFCTMMATMMMPMDDVHPIIIITGEGSKGKTTTMKLVTQLVDPDQGNECLIVSEDQRNILVTCLTRKTIGLDNASRLPISDDLLSQMYAGGTYKERQLFTNNEQSSIKIERMRVIINGVSPDFSKSDFFTKAIFLEQPRVTTKGADGEDRYISLSYVENRWRDMLPEAFGSLLTVIAEGLPHYQKWQARRIEEKRPADSMVRFVEFSVMGEAFSRAMGYKPDEFTAQVKALNATSKETAVQTDECAQLLIAWANGARGSSSGLADTDDLWSFQSGKFPKADAYEITSSDLYNELQLLAHSEGYNRYKLQWMNSPVAFGKRLRTSLPNINNSEWWMAPSGHKGSATTWAITKKV